MHHRSTLAVACSIAVVGASAAHAQWSETHKLTADDASADEGFGVDVSLSGDAALIGAAGDDVAGPFSGSAYVFRFDGAAWEQEAKLVPSDAEAHDQFGVAVALDGDVAVVGARFDDDLGENTGAVYVFRFDGATWIEEAKLVAPDAAADDAVGGAVAVSGDVIVAGARQFISQGPGAAHIFRFDGAGWTHDAALAASDGVARASFGVAVAVSGNTALVGAEQFFSGGRGAAYVFRYDGNAWAEEAILTGSEGAIGDQFGVAVDIDDDVAVVGARLDTHVLEESIVFQAGSAYAFRANEGVWSEEARLVAPDLEPGANFGSSIAIGGETLVIGTPADTDAGTSAGSAYVYDFTGETWAFATELTKSDPAGLDSFGHSVSVSGERLLIGDVFDDDDGQDSGSAYVFDFAGRAVSRADIDGTGDVGFGDIVAVLASWGPCPGCPADLNGDNAVTFADLLIVLGAWGPCE